MIEILLYFAHRASSIRWWLITLVKFFKNRSLSDLFFFSFSQASLLLWTLDDAKERVRNPALSLPTHTHPAQVPLACHLITLDTARGLKYEKKIPSKCILCRREMIQMSEQ